MLVLLPAAVTSEICQQRKCGNLRRFARRNASRQLLGVPWHRPFQTLPRHCRRLDRTRSKHSARRHPPVPSGNEPQLISVGKLTGTPPSCCIVRALQCTCQVVRDVHSVLLRRVSTHFMSWSCSALVDSRADSATGCLAQIAPKLRAVSFSSASARPCFPGPCQNR